MKNQKTLRPSAIAGAMPWLAREKSAARGNCRDVIQRAFRRTGRTGKRVRRAGRHTGRRTIRPENPGAGHPGQRPERHPLPRPGPPMQSADRRRPHEPDVERGRQGRRAALGHRRLPPVQDQHDQHRVAPQQAQGLGVFLLH